MKRLASLLTMLVVMTGMVMGQGNTAQVTQQGTNDTSNVTQSGTNNYAEYSVYGDDNFFMGEQDNSMKEEGAGNDMKVDQANWFDVSNYGNRVRAIQEGAGNDLDAILKGDENNITFKQEGRSNVIRGPGGAPVSTFTEDPFKYNGDRSMIHVEQIGFQNVVVGDIQGSNQVVDIYQESATDVDDNYSEVMIRGSLGSPSTQTVDVDQVGQNESDIDIWGDGNSVTHDQYGGDDAGDPEKGTNVATTEIHGDGNTSWIEQEGLRNEATHMIGNSDVTGNEARTIQDGRDNVAEVEQLSNDNYARQVQDAWNGISGTLDDDQEAEMNESYITQQGGVGNSAETYQFGDGNYVDIMQDGANNTAITDQGIWDQERPAATGFMSTHSDNNMIDIDQTGFGHTAEVIQIGSSNSSTISQSN
jgi:hypothetical protein